MRWFKWCNCHSHQRNCLSLDLASFSNASSSGKYDTDSFQKDQTHKSVLRLLEDTIFKYIKYLNDRPSFPRYLWENVIKMSCFGIFFKGKLIRFLSNIRILHTHECLTLFHWIQVISERDCISAYNGELNVWRHASNDEENVNASSLRGNRLSATVSRNYDLGDLWDRIHFSDLQYTYLQCNLAYYKCLYAEVFLSQHQRLGRIQWLWDQRASSCWRSCPSVIPSP